MSVTLIYRSNNSGGHWWLSDADWDALARNGWTVHWVDAKGNTPDSAYADDPAEVLAPVDKTDGRWIGDAAATSCAKQVDSVREGIREWSDITGEDAGAIGCNCCGRPHSFSYIDEDGEYHYVEVSMPSAGEVCYPD